MAAEYELILMLDPENPDERREEIATATQQRIEAAGTLRHGGSWGVRKLAYEIKLRNEADYRFFRFEGEPALLEDLDHNLKITDGILRFRIFKVDPRSPLIEPPAGTQLGAPRGRRDERGDRGAERDDQRAEQQPEAPASESSEDAVPAAEPEPAAPAPAEAEAAAPAPAEPAPAER